MRRAVVLGLAMIAGASCTAAVRWEKSGAGDAERQRDQAECSALASEGGAASATRSAASSTSVPYDPQRPRALGSDTTAFDECMKARGYERVAPRPPAS